MLLIRWPKVSPVHPRLRGELSRPQRPFCRFSRFIPACAGNSKVARASWKFRPVHPRLRGELRYTYANSTATGGSSPLARGTRFKLGSMITMSPVHPRLRGELNSRMDDPGELIGSSPLARGTRCISCDIRLKRRFIPACAGNSPGQRRMA